MTLHVDLVWDAGAAGSRLASAQEVRAIAEVLAHRGFVVRVGGTLAGPHASSLSGLALGDTPDAATRTDHIGVDVSRHLPSDPNTLLAPRQLWARRPAKARAVPQVPRVLVDLGRSGAQGHAVQVVRAFVGTRRPMDLTVIADDSPTATALVSVITGPDQTLKVQRREQVSGSLPGLVEQASLYVTSGAQPLWEAQFLGIPTLVVSWSAPSPDVALPASSVRMGHLGPRLATRAGRKGVQAELAALLATRLPALSADALRRSAADPREAVADAVVAAYKGDQIPPLTIADPPEYGREFDAACLGAAAFWPMFRKPVEEDSPTIVVELLMQDPRLVLRMLTVAASLACEHSARIVALVGPDPDWRREVWGLYDRARIIQLATAYGADEVIELDECIAAVVKGETTLRLGGRDVVVPERGEPDAERAAVTRSSTIIRILRIPRVENANALDPVDAIGARIDAADRFLEGLFASRPMHAFITSHVDYSPWGQAVDAAVRHEVPVVHVQSTGGLKAYTLFSGDAPEAVGFRRQLTLTIAAQFEEQVLAHRDVLMPLAERVAHRSKENRGRPSWWRGGGEVSRLDLRSTEERNQLRHRVFERYGLDASKPVVTVFNHAVSDAVQGNHEAFGDLVEWFEETARFAADHPEVTWLFLDHPSQDNYDRTGHFAGLAHRYAGARHLVFRASMDLTRNELWCLTDLAVTVRGSVSNEFPAYGVPALQAGWSEWSHLGISRRADTREEYWESLGESIRALLAGEPLITEEQVARARLWMWFYRSGADVVSVLAPHWETAGQGPALHRAVATGLNHVEIDGDAAFLDVHRMWARREPVLTRFDFTMGSGDLAARLGAPESWGSGAPVTVGLATAYDDLSNPVLPVTITSGSHPGVRIVEDVVRGMGIVGRIRTDHGAIVVDAGEPGEGAASLMTLAFGLDAPGIESWRVHSGLDTVPDTGGRPRRFRVGFEGEGGAQPASVQVIDLDNKPGARAEARLHLPTGRQRLVVVTVTSDDDRSALEHSAAGVRIDKVVLT